MQVVEKVVFKSCSYTIGLQLRKMKMYLINFMGAYMGDPRKILLKHKLLSKKVNFFIQLETNLIKKIIFQFSAAAGVSVKIFMVGPCAIAKLGILGHFRSNII